MILYEKFFRALRWNTIGSITYQGLFLLHQIALFKATNATLFGLSGALFSLIYLMVTLVNFGFDVSLTPFFTAYVHNKQTFSRFFMRQVLIQTALLSLCAGLLVMGSWLLGSSYPTTLGLCSPDFMIIIGILLVLEGTKKSLRTLLQLAFLNKVTAYLDMLTIIIYISLVWSWYLMVGSCSLMMIFIPMVLVSCIGLMVCGYYAYTIYRRLPDNSDTPKIGINRIVHSRLFNAIIQASHLIFSGNLLVPLFAMQFGVQTAGIFKLTSSVAYTITLILQKIFGLTTQALLAHVKESGRHAQQAAFAYITHILYQLLYAVIIFFIINHHLVCRATANTTWPILCIFFIIQLSEYFFMAYENFFIMQESTLLLAALTIGGMGLTWWLLPQALAVGISTVLLLLLAIRTTLFIIMGIIAWNLWHIRPSWMFQLRYAVPSIVFACLVYAITS